MSDTADAAAVPLVSVDKLARHTALISSLNLVSRLTGFVRILVVAAVLGTTFLGNTYQSANSVPNLVFELFAAGALQAILVPTLVEAIQRRGRAEAERIAGLVLGSLLAAMAVLLVVGMVAAPLIARLLFGGSPAGAAQVRLGTVFLWLFLPQVLFYAGGLVATAVLNAEDHFATPAFAPVVNNVVVTAAYLAFWALRRGEDPSLHLSPLEVGVLAGGTTLGVVAFTSVPIVALARRGVALRPRWHRGSEELRQFWRQGAWAAGFLALTQALLVTVLVLANRVEGGVVAYQLGFTFFLLPHALVAIPVFTAVFPGLSRAFVRGDDGAFAPLVRRSVSTISVLILPAAAALFALAEPIARLTLFGNGEAGVHQVALATRAFAPGLLPYGLFLLLTRVAYARNDARLPTHVNLVATVVGVGIMSGAAALLHGDARIAGLAAAHSATYLVGAVVLASRLRRRSLAATRYVPIRTVVVTGSAAIVAAAVMGGIAAGLGGTSRGSAALEVVVAGVVGLTVYLVLIAAGGLAGSARHLLRGARNA
ncbi:MAG: murein biosynthesis integral membrane protein MurJ [Microthrixaceae bacterium]